MDYVIMLSTKDKSVMFISVMFIAGTVTFNLVH